VADTLAANIAESTQELIAATVAQLPGFSPMVNLVTRIPIPKGRNVAEIPRWNSSPTILTPTEGDDIVTTSQFDYTSTTITPTLRAVKVRISERAQYHSRDNLIASVSRWLAMAEAEDIDDDLTAEFANFHTDNDVGTTNTDLTIAVMRTARRLLQAVTRANGGPAPAPLYYVLAPIPVEDLITNLGLQGAVANANPWIPEGLSQSLIEQYAIPNDMMIVGVKGFVDSYMAANGSGDFICGMFSKEALHLAISKEWDMKTFEESNFVGTILRAVADYNAGVGAYTHWGSQITADGA
jgi:hypothetical protein